ncbi:MAG: hypothetical protein R3F50_02630 [Gammaproteobacteria bacterium]
MFSKVELQKAYSQLLAEYNWQWFCTLTFRNPPHPEAAVKLFKVWINKINREIYGCRYHKRKQCVYWALALEYHKSGVLHFHALVGDSHDLNTRCSRKWAHSNWYELGGINRIDPIDDRLKAVTNYISKYVTKGGEIDFSDNLVGYGLQLSGVEV